MMLIAFASVSSLPLLPMAGRDPITLSTRAMRFQIKTAFKSFSHPILKSRIVTSAAPSNLLRFLDLIYQHLPHQGRYITIKPEVPQLPDLHPKFFAQGV
jgi:hypothetical protein